MQWMLNAAICSGLLLGSMWTLTGCSTSAAKPALPGASGDPPEVMVARPVERPIIDYEEFTGRTDAVETVDVRARVTGFLEKTEFSDGDEVAENQSLFVIDHRPYDADDAAAKASLESSLAHQAQKESDYARVKQLRDKGQVSLEEYDRALAQKQEADAKVDEDRANLQKTQLNVDFCYIKAPIAGRISRAQITDGNLVTADTTVLTTIVSVDDMYVYFDVDERAMLRFQKMLREEHKSGYREETVPVYMALALDEGFPHEGAINFVENRLDPNTGTIRVRAKFKNPKPEFGPRLFTPGLFARVRLPVSQEHPALMIPERAIGSDQGQKYVYVVDQENRAQYRRIVTGSVIDGMRVVREGLTADDRVVVNGLQRVRPKAPVKPREGGDEGASAESKAGLSETPAAGTAAAEKKAE